MPDRVVIDKNEWFPVQAFFNAIPDDLFWGVTHSLMNGVGYSMNDCHCEFPVELDYDEEPFSGVRFSLFEDEIVLTEKEMKEMLRQVCESQVKRHPDEESRFSELFL